MASMDSKILRQLFSKTGPSYGAQSDVISHECALPHNCRKFVIEKYQTSLRENCINLGDGKREWLVISPSYMFCLVVVCGTL